MRSSCRSWFNYIDLSNSIYDMLSMAVCQKQERATLRQGVEWATTYQSRPFENDPTFLVSCWSMILTTLYDAIFWHLNSTWWFLVYTDTYKQFKKGRQVQIRIILSIDASDLTLWTNLEESICTELFKDNCKTVSLKSLY